MKKKISNEEKSQSAAQNRCIWMTAGVISFKLCPLDYDCDNCDFDEVMRSQVQLKKEKSRVKIPRAEIVAGLESPPCSGFDSEKSFFFTFSPTRADEKLHLCPAHLWIDQVKERQWRIGVDELLAYTLPPPQKVQLPEPEREIIQDQVFGRVFTKSGEVLLTAPLSGCLIQVNPTLAQYPELVQKDPCGEGWLMVIDSSPHVSELKKFHTGPAGRRFLEEEAQHLRFLLKHKGIQVDQIGDTLPDGGLHIKYLHQVLPGQVCLKLALELTASGKHIW